MEKKNRSEYFIPAVFAVIKFFVSIFGINSAYQLQRDEYLYLAEGRHLAWGFDEVPPMISFLGRITYELGNSFFMVKFWPALFGALTAFLLGIMVSRLGGNRIAQLLAGFSFLLSSYLRIHILFQPNVLDIFFWTLIAYSIICFYQTGKNKWLYMAGIALGFGLLSKYMIAVFMLSLFIGILLTRQRKLLVNKHLWFSLGIAFLIFLPNFIWQLQHQFPALQHAEELKQTQLQFISPLTFLMQQLLLLLNSVPVWILGLWFFARDKSARQFSFFAWTYLIMLITFTLTGGKDYYTLGIYPLLVAGGSVWIEQHTEKRKWIAYALTILIILIGLDMIPIMLPFMSPEKSAAFYKKNGTEKLGVLQWEDGKNHPLPQDFADMLGWNELAQKTSAIYEKLPDSIRKNTSVYCYNYGEAGALLYYSKQFSFPEIYSHSSSFQLWMPETIPSSSLIIISDSDPPKSSDNYLLNNIQLMDSITDPLAREYGSKIYFVGEVKPRKSD